MSYKATNWAYDMKITGPSKPVLVALADMADESASCYPGQDRLSEMTGLSVPTVARALKRLEDYGLLTRERRFGKFGYRTSDRYRLNLTVTMPESLPITAPTRQRAYKAESQVLPIRESIPNHHSDGAIEPSVNHQRNHQGERPRPFCPKHPDGTTRSCRPCGDARRLFDAWVEPRAETPSPKLTDACRDHGYPFPCPVCAEAEAVAS